MFAADSIDTKKKNLLSGFLDDGDYGDAVAVGNRAIDGDAPPPNSESSFDVASRWDVSMLFETKKGTDDANVVSHSRRGHPLRGGSASSSSSSSSQRALASVSDSTGRRKQKQPPQKFRVERDSRRRERHEKRERFETEFTRTEQTHGEQWRTYSSGGYHDEAKKAREKGGFGTFYREGG